MRILLIILVLWGLSIHGQEGNNKLKGERISFVPLFGFFVTENDPLNGLPFHLDATFLHKNHRYKLAMNSGFEGPSLNILGGGPHTSHGYLDLGVLYGREWPLFNWLYVESYAGASFFAKIINTKKTNLMTGEEREVELYTITAGLPLHVQLRFQLNKRFSLGLQYHGNINHLNIVNSFGLAFGFRLGLHKKHTKVLTQKPPTYPLESK